MNNMQLIDQNGDTERKKRIQKFKSILNYYRANSLSLDMIIASKKMNVTIPAHMKTPEELNKNTQLLRDDISLINSLKDCLKLINNSLTCTELMGVNDLALKRSLMHKIEGIIYFSKSILKLFDEEINEMELIQKKRNYHSALEEYGKNLDALQKTHRKVDSESAKVLEKAELQVYKINFMRAMKATLIGFISVNRPDLLRRVHKTPVRRNLTVEDFNDTWDVGLTSQSFRNQAEES